MADKIKSIGVWRDQWFAHRQNKYFDSPEKMSRDSPLLMKDIEELIQYAKNLISQLRWSNKTGHKTLC
jgi:hypothetical protein